MERPAWLAFLDRLRAASGSEILRQMFGKAVCLRAVQKPVGADCGVEEKNSPPDPDDPRRAEAVDFFKVNRIAVTGGEFHRASVVFV